MDHNQRGTFGPLSRTSDMARHRKAIRRRRAVVPRDDALRDGLRLFRDAGGAPSLLVSDFRTRMGQCGYSVPIADRVSRALIERGWVVEIASLLALTEAGQRTAGPA
jgi:hypothetical protein